MVIYALISIITSVLQLVPSYIITSWVILDYEDQQAADHLVAFFIGSIIAYMIMVMIRALTLKLFMLNASTNMHNQMSAKIIRSKI